MYVFKCVMIEDNLFCLIIFHLFLLIIVTQYQKLMDIIVDDVISSKIALAQSQQHFRLNMTT